MGKGKAFKLYLPSEDNFGTLMTIKFPDKSWPRFPSVSDCRENYRIPGVCFGSRTNRGRLPVGSARSHRKAGSDDQAVAVLHQHLPQEAELGIFAFAWRNSRAPGSVVAAWVWFNRRSP
ncbi:MAG: hypothetical protein JRG72_02950 [Deltaproteobacteria bacterium]|nr:hypothetical protein [Deltaproteobacteria bacterium]